MRRKPPALPPTVMSRWYCYIAVSLVLGAGCSDAKLPQECAAGCPTDKPVCSEVLEKCVECVGDADCKDATKPLCQTSTGKCGACLDNDDCNAADKARCDSETLLCVACQAHSDCKGIAGKPACGPDGICVECTTDNETGCDGKICEPGANVCSETVAQDSAENCEPCVADSECKDDHKCVPMLYQDAAHGSYCLKLRGPGCVEPFRVELDRTSLNSSQDETFCGVNEDLTTCEALLAYNSECDEDGKCIIDDVEVEVAGAICRAIAVPTRCTYYCSNATQCDLDIVCPGSGDPIANDRYCGK